VRVAWARPDAPALADAAVWLGPPETARAARLAPRARARFVAARGLLRLVIAAETGAAPAAIALGATPGAAPGLLAPAQPAALALALSLSHAEGLVAAAAARGAAVGVDVEPRARRVPAAALARRFFAPAEARALAGLPEGERRARFLALFTLKEAWLKATGRGLAGGLARPRFDPAAAGRGELGRDAFALEDDDPARWWLFSGAVAAHWLAVAVRPHAHARPCVVIEELAAAPAGRASPSRA
jgi:4'-phosphopantetheinyl transferase